MLTNKNRVKGSLALCLGFSIVFAGCTPPGPRALLEGKKRIEQGRPAEAIEDLKVAVSLLGTNAHAWNYLGLAHHHAGQPAEAVKAYQRALTLNQDLIEARFNLGCLWLEQNRPDLAKPELTAYTLRRPHGADGWLKLGAAQLRTRDLAGAERSFNEALRRSAGHPEALNGLGMVQFQRNRPREAAQFFTSALKQHPGHSAALLNMAVVAHQHPTNHPFALQKYREYLALTPRPPHAEAVSAAARALEQDLAAASRPATTSVPAPPIATTAPPAVVTVAPAPVTTAAPPAVAANTNVAAVKPATNAQARAVVQAKPEPPPAATNAGTTPLEVVKLAPEPLIKPAQDMPPAVTSPGIAPSHTPPRTAEPERAPAIPPSVIADQPPQAKPGFFQRMNPVNLLRRESKPAPDATPLPESTPSAGVTKPAPAAAPVATETASASVTPAPPPAQPRYQYRSPAKPAAGNRAEAERAFAQGVDAQRAGRAADASQAFRRAAQLDPSYYEAHINLGLMAAEAGELQQALAAYETAMAIRPDAPDTRCNFALVLRQAGYVQDAINELEKVLASHPAEARAHLALGNIYAQQLRQPARARVHYNKVLEIDPRHPQAAAIRYWLTGNPP
jgi:tetratricopeptide (TPR) repeat protein